MSYLVLLAAAAVGATGADIDPDPAWLCTAKHYGAFVSPSGTSATWPVLKSLPEHLRGRRPILLATSGAYAGGKSHVMYVDSKTSEAYIEQAAGTLDSVVIFGPLPKFACSDPAATGILDLAQFFMNSYADDVSAGERKALANRYSRRGTIFIGGEWKEEVAFDKLSREYATSWKPPVTFRWQGLAFEKLGEEAVMITGGVARGDKAGAETFSHSYAVLLIKEDGVLRIRMESGASPVRPQLSKR